MGNQVKAAKTQAWRLPLVGPSRVSSQIKFFVSCGGQPGCDVLIEGAVELPPGGGER